MFSFFWGGGVSIFHLWMKSEFRKWVIFFFFFHFLFCQRILIKQVTFCVLLPVLLCKTNERMKHGFNTLPNLPLCRPQRRRSEPKGRRRSEPSRKTPWSLRKTTPTRPSPKTANRKRKTRRQSRSLTPMARPRRRLAASHIWVPRCRTVRFSFRLGEAACGLFPQVSDRHFEYKNCQWGKWTWDMCVWKLGAWSPNVFNLYFKAPLRFIYGYLSVPFLHLFIMSLHPNKMDLLMA